LLYFETRFMIPLFEAVVMRKRIYVFF